MIGRGVRQFEIGSQNTCTTKGLLKEKVKRRKQKRARTYATECRISIVNERLIFRFLRRYRSVFVSAVRLKRKIGGSQLWGDLFFLFLLLTSGSSGSATASSFWVSVVASALGSGLLLGDFAGLPAILSQIGGEDERDKKGKENEEEEKEGSGEE